MDVPTAESQLTAEKQSWLERERESGRLYRYAALVVAIILAGTVAFSLWMLKQPASAGTLLWPPLIALLLIANLIPAIALMVLFSRRIAMQRAAVDLLRELSHTWISCARKERQSNLLHRTRVSEPPTRC